MSPGILILECSHIGPIIWFGCFYLVTTNDLSMIANAATGNPWSVFVIS